MREGAFETVRVTRGLLGEVIGVKAFRRERDWGVAFDLGSYLTAG